MHDWIEYGYIGLFIASFLAATILPLSSELVLSALLLSGAAPSLVVAIATTANVLGSLTNYALGYWTRTQTGLKLVNRWFKTSETALMRAEQLFSKYGLMSLLCAWVPLIGDPLTVIAGILRVPLYWFILLVTIGKLTRYIVISQLVLATH